MSNQCECQTDGFCQRYQRPMEGRLREICRGVNIAPEKAEAYRANWTKQAQDKPRHGWFDRLMIGLLVRLGWRQCAKCGGITSKADGC